MKTQQASKLLVMMLALYLISGAVARAEEAHIFVTAPDLKWSDDPFPNTRIAVLEGDPKSPAPFTMRQKLAAGYKIPPHWHPSDERVPVISGTFNVGHGRQFHAYASHNESLHFGQGEPSSRSTESVRGR